MFEILSIDGGVCAPDGFLANGISAGLKGEEKLDIGYIYMQNPCVVYTHFTKNAFQAAPLRYFLESVQGKKSNFILINTKNANAMTGKEGIRDIEEILSHLKQKYPEIQNPIMCSTGVIGVRLPKEVILNALPKINLKDMQEDSHTRAAQAIMTTDSYSKEVAFLVKLEDGSSFKLGAMAKGAGMIAPSLATMLCFITTDARVEESEIRDILKECIEDSFDSISVDGDMSTNDSVMLASSYLGGYDRDAFRMALKMALQKLAYDIVRDGEGASRVVNFRVTGAKNKLEAKRIAKTLSNSLLVKTAIFGGDPNWGRIASTIGACGAQNDIALCVECDEESLQISIAGCLIYDKGQVYFDREQEQKVAALMKKGDFEVHCDLGIGDGEYSALGCDLGYEYVRINADYRS